MREQVNTYSKNPLLINHKYKLGPEIFSKNKNKPTTTIDIVEHFEN